VNGLAEVVPGNPASTNPGYTVVVIEDDEGVLRLILKQLSRDSIRTVGFREETEALRWIEENRSVPLLLVLDYRLQKMDGKRFLSELSVRGISAPFLVVTGHGDERVAVDMMKLGAKDYLVKDARFLDLLPAAVSRTVTALEMERRLEQVEGQLRQSQKMEAVGRLAAGVAHDFNNLLTAITGYSELVLSRLDSDNPVRKDVEEIQTAARRAAGLTRQLLTFSRKQAIQPKVVDLGEVVRGVEKLLRRTIGEDVELVTEISGSAGSIFADPGQIEQVLLNLAVNARDAMPAGGKLVIRVEGADLPESLAREGHSGSPGPQVLLTVSDTGCGMDAKTLERIFEPFFTTKEVDKGTGLGLATVYGIVKQANGRTRVDSAPGKGTAFRIWFPRSPEKEAAPEPPVAQAAGVGGSETILVVEDSDTVLGLVRAVLQNEGYNVLAAGHGEEALRICREFDGRIRLVLTDMVMPNMNGLELAGRLRALRPGTKILFMSGYTEEGVHEEGLISTGDPFLQKPFTPKALAARIRGILDADPAA
jgi:two-component system cell cycle sensor histidine kinase/response regulator CckA